MKHTSISIVPAMALYPNNTEKANEILNWLISDRIVEPMLSPCLPGVGDGYRLGEGAKKIVQRPEELPFGLPANGMEVTTFRRVFHAGDGGLNKVRCPHCRENILDHDWDLNPWIRKEIPQLRCPMCKQQHDLSAFETLPLWGFSNLGFSFWNWPPFQTSFVKTFTDRLGCQVKLVKCQLP